MYSQISPHISDLFKFPFTCVFLYLHVLVILFMTLHDFWNSEYNISLSYVQMWSKYIIVSFLCDEYPSCLNLLIWCNIPAVIVIDRQTIPIQTHVFDHYQHKIPVSSMLKKVLRRWDLVVNSDFVNWQ